MGVCLVALSFLPHLSTTSISCGNLWSKAFLLSMSVVMNDFKSFHVIIGSTVNFYVAIDRIVPHLRYIFNLRYHPFWSIRLHFVLYDNPLLMAKEPGSRVIAPPHYVPFCKSESGSLHLI